ncbi:S-layer homology domain-containing protein [Ammoniphilus sp. CFH 90114]|uniref:S-layer homology domain-containing protein n=1 Tax=Ammoniphilus sp. CFH 90114 TaxID=2493665 RepID=UPI00100EBD4B|nr:S-layer homology domain-containing protein [Ammoniphilus sp. CFH 90114]RXT06493.1 S-layer homology domain-containing protein [Ammoniphilus sp. CFH 90114]
MHFLSSWKSILVIAVLFTSLPFSPTGHAESQSAFTDTMDHWAKETIDWAVREDIVKGFPDGTFRPNQTLREREFITMLFRTMKDSPLLDWSAIERKPWPMGYLIQATELGYPGYVLSNYPNRRQVAEFLAASQGVHYQGDQAVQYLLTINLAHGKQAGVRNLESFRGDDTLTRAEAVQFLKNAKEKGLKELQQRPKSISPLGNLQPLPVTESILNPFVQRAHQALVSSPEFNGKALLDLGARTIFINPYGTDKPEDVTLVLQIVPNGTWTLRFYKETEAETKAAEQVLTYFYPSSHQEAIHDMYLRFIPWSLIDKHPKLDRYYSKVYDERYFVLKRPVFDDILEITIGYKPEYKRKKRFLALFSFVQFPFNHTFHHSLGLHHQQANLVHSQKEDTVDLEVDQ